MTNESIINNEVQKMLDSFWPNVMEDVKNLRDNDLKNQELPLARIKKIMKLDEDVGLMMISGEAPVLFAKAAEIFITELTLRAWIHTEENKRRTLQRNDVAMAITKYDMFDFLIDIVPREELKLNTVNRRQEGQLLTGEGIAVDTLNSDPVYLQLLQQDQTETSSSNSTNGGQPLLIQAQNTVQTGQNQRTQNINNSQLLFSMYPQIQ